MFEPLDEITLNTGERMIVAATNRMTFWFRLKVAWAVLWYRPAQPGSEE
jgi:hypothetical protein